ncbi:MAG: TonB-dependent receptor [Novosphingobium sp.]|nr:TonB-dependent receptor [Novosphingobium sp.]
MRSIQSVRRRLLVGVSAVAAAVASPAFAQDQGASAQSQAGTPEESGVALDDIVVTAQRRAENLQDVPIAVSAVTAEALQNTGITSTRELTQIVPSVQITRSGPSALFFIRGVGTTNAAAGEEGANALYIDNVYLGDLGQGFNNFNNIERVEVLKGPQGTLFGRNATGGLIHIVTRDPGNDLVVKGEVGYANYDRFSSQLYVGGPITDKVSADIALTYANQNDGWGRNLTTGAENKVEKFFGVRSKIVVRPSDDVKFTLAGDYYKNKDNLGLGWRIADGTLATGGYASPGGQDTTSNRRALTDQRIYGVSLTGEADLGFATLTSVSAYRNNRNISDFDVDGGPQDLLGIAYTSTAKTIQQELRLASNNSGPLSWQLGGFYLNSKAATSPQQITGLQNVQIDAALDTNSYALFGEASYKLTPTTTLTAGARYTIDDRKFSGTTRPILSGSGPTAVLGAVVPSASSNAANSNLNTKEWTYRISLRQEITPDVSVYGSVNRGFKAGTFNLQSPGNLPALPQFIMAYEVGLKSELFNRRLRLNLAAYHYDIDDFQVRSAALLGNGGLGTSILQNAATVKVDGIDLDFEFAATERLRFFGGATLLNARFGQFGGPGAATQAAFVYLAPATCTAPATANPGTEGAGPRTGGIVVCGGDASGNKMPFAPKFAASIGATYTLPVGEHGELRTSLLLNHNSGYYFEPDNFRRQQSFDIVNASLEYRPMPKFGIELWAKNLTDAGYSVQQLSTAPFVVLETMGAPRTYGINAKFDF